MTCELKTRSKIGPLTTLRTRHLVLKYVIIYLLLIISGKKTVCAVIRCNTGIHKRKSDQQNYDILIVKFSLQLQ